MMKLLKKGLGVLSFCLIFTMTAREWRTPRVFQNGYPYAHYPFLRVDGKCFNINVWGAGLHRIADEAFLDKQTTKRQNLSGILFGKPSFTLADLGLSGALPLSITPRIDYSETDAYFGLIGEWVRGCNCQWRLGFRANLPFRTIKTSLDSCCELEASLADVCCTQNELVCETRGTQSFIHQSYAYRLDFLSELKLATNSNDLFVKYADPNRGDRITMGDQDVTNVNNLTCGGTDPQAPPIMVVSRPDGSKPDTPFSLRNINQTPFTPGTAPDCSRTPACALPLLNADGTGLAEEERANFNSVTDYTSLGNNQAQQSTLWVVPMAQFGQIQDGIENFDINKEARTIQGRINAIIQQFGQSAISFLKGKGITFADRSRTGVGDFDLEFYARRDWCNFFLQPIVGLRLPTGRRIDTPKQLLLMPTGNNGHLELKFGGMGGWNPNDWFAMKADFFYNYVTSRKEKVAASFVGQTVKNIGPTTCADISWQYVVGDIDFTFLVPCIEPSIGIDAGYQLYAKGKDGISFDCTTAKNLVGVNQMLDASVLQFRTNQVAHKLKGEVFYQTCDWHFFAGFQHVIAGKNSPNDSDWYLGCQIYF